MLISFTAVSGLVQMGNHHKNQQRHRKYSVPHLYPNIGSQNIILETWQDIPEIPGTNP